MESATPPTVPKPVSERDAEHLRLLTIFHYVLGGLHMAIASVFMVHFVVGFLMANRGQIFGPNPPPPWIGMLLMFIGAMALLIGWTVGICTVISGRFIARRKRRIFSLVVAGTNCASFPFGTALGIFTFIVLLRDSVRRLYG